MINGLGIIFFNRTQLCGSPIQNTQKIDFQNPFIEYSKWDFHKFFSLILMSYFYPFVGFFF